MGAIFCVAEKVIYIVRKRRGETFEELYSRFKLYMAKHKYRGHNRGH